MTEYGEIKELQEILEELALYCSTISMERHDIKIILPQKIIQSFNDSFAAKERIVVYGEFPKKYKVVSWYNTGIGMIELFSDEDNEVMAKETV